MNYILGLQVTCLSPRAPSCWHTTVFFYPFVGFVLDRFATSFSYGAGYAGPMSEILVGSVGHSIGGFVRDVALDYLNSELVDLD